MRQCSSSVLCLWLVFASSTLAQDAQLIQSRFAPHPIHAMAPDNPPDGYQFRMIDGFTIVVSQELLDKKKAQTERTLFLLKDQLKHVRQLVPEPALSHLKTVPMWVSPKYPGTRGGAAYHPNEAWLRSNKRNPLMARSIEFTNVDKFEPEIRRMPVLVLHEMAHAYHHQVLGWDHAGVTGAYRDAMKAGLYDAVRRGNDKIEKAYAANNAKEYFAEQTEAFFALNDFYPFNRTQLMQHDPAMVKVLTRVWHINPAPQKD